MGSDIDVRIPATLHAWIDEIKQEMSAVTSHVHMTDGSGTVLC